MIFLAEIRRASKMGQHIRLEGYVMLHLPPSTTKACPDTVEYALVTETTPGKVASLFRRLNREELVEFATGPAAYQQFALVASKKGVELS